MDSCFIFYRNSKLCEKDIHDIFPPDTDFTSGARYWGMSGIIKVPDTLRDYILLATYRQKQADHEFEEDVDENGILIWQS